MGVNRYQAMSAFIKCIRLRRATEAASWLMTLQGLNVYLPQINRRIAMCAAEDGLHPGVMEKVSRLVHKDTCKSMGIVNTMAEILRIRNTPNWYATKTGRAFIWEWRKQHQAQTFKGKLFSFLLPNLEAAIVAQDVERAFSFMYPLCGSEGFTPGALREMFSKHVKPGTTTFRKLKVYYDIGGTIGGDENYPGQIVYELCTGIDLSDGADCPVIYRTDVEPILKKVKPQTQCPSYWLDGVHVYGKDKRFGGIHESMWGMCQAFVKFGRVHPDDEWPEEFWLATPIKE